jgi:hypothetical protein
MSVPAALELASSQSLDLVEVSPNAEPPVCRIMDFGKYQFEQNKKANAGKKKQKQSQIKEVKFRPGTEEGDYQVKMRNLVRFLEQGAATHHGDGAEEKVSVGAGLLTELCYRSPPAPVLTDAVQAQGEKNVSKTQNESRGRQTVPSHR